MEFTLKTRNGKAIELTGREYQAVKALSRGDIDGAKWWIQRENPEISSEGIKITLKTLTGIVIQ